jgi:hypothetical protein
VGLYLEWDLSHFIYYFFFLNLFVASHLCVGYCFLIFIFFNYSCLIKLGPYEIDAF